MSGRFPETVGVPHPGLSWTSSGSEMSRRTGSVPASARCTLEAMKGDEARTGTFLGVPYDWRRPTKERLKHRLWNADESRILTPRAFGWGYDINFHRLFPRSPK